MPLLVAEQRSDEWHAARAGKITASLAAACLGLCPFTSRQAAWRAIRGERPKENKHMRWGSKFEDIARQAYEIETGCLIEDTGFWIHPDIPWLGASPDGLIGDDGILEVKVPTNKPTMVPINYRIQMIVQLAVTGRQWCDFYAWNHEWSFRRRVYLAGWEGILRRLSDFYQQHVVAGVEPPKKARKKRGRKKNEDDLPGVGSDEPDRQDS